MSQDIMREFIFWGIWLTIPLLVDILAGMFCSLVVFIGRFKRKAGKLDFYPTVTILIPVYRSKDTLKSCLKSIAHQDYPHKNISVILINNGQKDEAYDVFCSFQAQYSNIRLWWLDSSQGKSKALNKGLYMADGKYIINIDSDGVLDKRAVRRVVEKFEISPDIYAMTGVVLTNHKLIEKTRGTLLKLVRRCELFEYSESFLIGRSFQSMTDTMFTLAGAFSCYRKDAILKTQLYNSETLGEDTHMTSQIREFLKGRVALCEDAFFYADPVESLDKLYIQRQRWQRGEMEVSSLFQEVKGAKGIANVFKITMIMDHTLVFPRFIWLFAMMYLIFFDYPLKLIFGANIIMYFVYCMNSFLYYLVSRLYLKEQWKTVIYMDKHIYIILLLPVYRFIVFLMRVAGIINSAEKDSSWNVRTFSDEKKLIYEKVSCRLKPYNKMRDWINNR